MPLSLHIGLFRGRGGCHDGETDASRSVDVVGRYCGAAAVLPCASADTLPFLRSTLRACDKKSANQLATQPLASLAIDMLERSTRRQQLIDRGKERRLGPVDGLAAVEVLEPGGHVAPSP